MSDTVNNRTRLRLLTAAAIGLLAILMVLLYLGWSRQVYRLGFPLDDAWIHQTYARNLAGRGEWAFQPGRPSAGSTSPLWTMMLAAGYLVAADPRLWTFSLGTLALAATAYAAGRWARRRAPGLAWIAVAAALTVVLEWHLVWSAASGMETLLMAGLVVTVLGTLGREPWKPFVSGALIGLGVWARPDALTLLGPGLWHAWTRPATALRRSAADSLQLVAGVACGVVPYALFLRLLGGEWWPSTFYAKQAEYAVLTQAPLWSRFAGVAAAPLAGAGGLLLVGFVVDGLRRLRERAWAAVAPHLWLVGSLVVYTLRLPVSYQHGRYQIPILPVLVVLGWCGIGPWLAKQASRVEWVAGRVWLGALAVVVPLFLAAGGRAYAQDVSIIESEMVDTARWVEANTPADARIAAHDIGALGYFGDRPLVDLAGLTDPELIPILRDEPALAEAMRARRVTYLMTFPGWYPALSACGQAVFVSSGVFSPAAGGENMVVYRWDPTTFAARPTCMLYSP